MFDYLSVDGTMGLFRVSDNDISGNQPSDYVILNHYTPYTSSIDYISGPNDRKS